MVMHISHRLQTEQMAQYRLVLSDSITAVLGEQNIEGSYRSAG